MLHPSKTAYVLAALGLCALPVQSARAQLTTFVATDSGAVPGDTFFNSNAAAAQFDAAAAALGREDLVTFEAAPVGSFTSLTIAPGVTLTGLSYKSGSQAILNAPADLPHPAHEGFNTTPGGSNYVELAGGTETFVFAAPVQAFGLYFTGVQPYYYQDMISFNDGADQFISVPAGDDFSGGVSFVGFTDAGKSISSVSVLTSDSNGQDYIGLDDLRTVNTSPVPEASTAASSAALLLSSLLCTLVVSKRKIKKFSDAV